MKHSWPNFMSGLSMDQGGGKRREISARESPKSASR